MEELRAGLEECKKELKRLEANVAADQLHQQQVFERKASKKSLLLHIRGKGSSSCLTAAEGDEPVVARYRRTCAALEAIAEEALNSPEAAKGLDAAALQKKLEERERAVAEGVEKVADHISTFTQVLLSIPLSDKHRMEVQTSLGHVIRDLQPLRGVGQRKRCHTKSLPSGERPSERLKQKIAEKKRRKKEQLERNALKFETITEDVRAHFLSSRDRSNTLAAMPRPSPRPSLSAGADDVQSKEESRQLPTIHRLRRWKSELLLDSWDAPAFLRDVAEVGEAAQEEAGETVVQEDADELKSILRRQRTIRKTLAVPSPVAPFAPAEQRDIGKRLTFVLTNEGQQLLVGGEIEDIWIWVVAKSGNEKDLCTLLLLFRPYTTAAVLVDVLDRFLSDQDEVNEVSLQRIHFGLSVWIKLFVDDFIRDRAAGNGLIAVIGKLEALLHPETHSSLEMEGRSLKNVMQAHVTAVLADRSSPGLREPVPLSPRGPRGKREFLQLPCRDLARQLCMVEFEKFARVVAADTISAKDRAASPTIAALVEHFNRMSGWVSTEVVMNPNVKKRAAIVRGFIGLALACLQLRNYNAVLEIVAGLNQSVVQRLKKTWKMAALKQLELLMDPQGNYKAYRETMKTTKLPAVPYVGIYLKDATFIDEGNKDFLESGAANFEKMRMKAALISSIEFFQLRAYKFGQDEEIKAYLQTVAVMDEKTAYKHSLQCEPRTMDV